MTKKDLKELIEAIRNSAKTLWEINRKHHTMNPKCVLLDTFEEIIKEIEEEEKA